MALVLILGTSAAFSEPLTPEEAGSIASSFVKAKSARYKRAVKNVRLKHVYTAPAKEGNAFYVFSDNESGLFTIVSADSRLSQILGFSFSSAFDADKIPCNLRWWLDNAQQEITAYLDSEQAQSASTRAIETSDVVAFAPVEPLITTKWNQDGPYNITCPMIGGVRCPTGCAATAMAQVLKFHNYPEKGFGERNGYDFEHEFYWDLMLDDYSTTNYSSQNARAVADLMLACGKSMDMLYMYSQSGADTYIQQHSLVTYFGYDKDVRIIERDYIRPAEWTSMIYKELAEGRPVIYGGVAPAGGHEFVCDGYADGMFHINWGWGGLSDGYFRLTDLTPSDNGIGGYNGGYNSQQFAFINVQPDDGNGDVQRYIITNGPFIYDGEMFSVSTSQVGRRGVFYNPLVEGFYVEAGVKVCDINGRFICYVADPEGANLEEVSGFEGFTVEMPQLPDGRYKLFPVFRANGGEWLPVSIPVGQQDYVAMKISDGIPEYINEWRSDANNYALAFSDITFSNDMSAGVPGSFSFYVHNVGKGSFNDPLFVVVTDADGNRLAEIDANVNVKSNSSSLVCAAKTLDLPEGTYFASIEDKDYNEYASPVEFRVDSTLSAYKLNAPTLEIKEPFNVSQTLSDVVVRVVNRSQEERKLVVRILSDDCKTTIASSASNPYILAANASGRRTIEDLNISVPAGSYRIDITDDAGNVLTPPYPFTVRGAFAQTEDVAVEAVSDEILQFAPPSAGEYAGHVVIPSEVDGKSVFAIRPDALALADRVTELTIPSSVTHIGKSDFFGMDALEKLNIETGHPFDISAECMNEDRFPQITLKVPGASANIFKRADVWSRFDVPGWEITYPADVALVEGLDADKNGEVFAPYYIEAGTSLKFTLLPPDDKLLRVHIAWPDGHKKVLASDGAVSLPSLDSGVGQVVIEVAGADGIEDVTAAPSARDVYDLDGFLLIRNASDEQLRALPEGLYIIGGSPVIVPRR